VVTSHADAARATPGNFQKTTLIVGRQQCRRPDLIRNLSGITERRVWDDGVQPSDVAAQAGEKAIAAAGIDKGQLGTLVNTSVCRDYIEPSTACIVHSKLGLPETCMNFDLGNACLAFINGMDMVGNMIEQGQIDYGIVVDAESSKFSTDSGDRISRMGVTPISAV